MRTMLEIGKDLLRFIEDIVRLACLCDENNTDSMEIGFTLKDGRRAIVEMTFRTEDGDHYES